MFKFLKKNDFIKNKSKQNFLIYTPMIQKMFNLIKKQNIDFPNFKKKKIKNNIYKTQVHKFFKKGLNKGIISIQKFYELSPNIDIVLILFESSIWLYDNHHYLFAVNMMLDFITEIEEKNLWKYNYLIKNAYILILKCILEDKEIDINSQKNLVEKIQNLYPNDFELYNVLKYYNYS